MRLQLEDRWVSYLCRLPESGTGYQRVDVQLKDGSEIEGVFVFNAKELEWPYAHLSITSDDIAKIQLSQRGK